VEVASATVSFSFLFPLQGKLASNYLDEEIYKFFGKNNAKSYPKIEIRGKLARFIPRISGDRGCF
jgi:hypothetical protein